MNKHIKNYFKLTVVVSAAHEALFSDVQLQVVQGSRGQQAPETRVRVLLRIDVPL